MKRLPAFFRFVFKLTKIIERRGQPQSDKAAFCTFAFEFPGRLKRRGQPQYEKEVDFSNLHSDLKASSRRKGSLNMKRPPFHISFLPQKLMHKEKASST